MSINIIHVHKDGHIKGAAMFRNRHKQTASAIKTISPSLDLFPSKHSTEHAVHRFSFSHLFICVFVCLCVWKSEAHVGPRNWTRAARFSSRRLYLPSRQFSFSSLILILHFIFWLKQNQNIPNTLKSNHKIIFLVTVICGVYFAL